LIAGCQQQMADQPTYKPMEPSDLFDKGRSVRPLVPGTVARGHLRTDQTRYAGLVADARPGADGPRLEDYATAFPVPVTRELLARGRERFTIYCSVCHHADGTGNGKIVERGFTRPPSLLTDHSRGFAHRGRQIALREVPIGYVFEVISKGYGAMPEYGTQVPPDDRWAIAAYVRALQLSHHVRLADLPKPEQDAARAALEGHRGNGQPAR
jgi:mono/diheme cytochrome c family protein